MNSPRFDPQARFLHLNLANDYRDLLEKTAKALAQLEGNELTSPMHVRRARNFLVSGHLQWRRREAAKTFGNVLIGVFVAGLPLTTPLGSATLNVPGAVFVSALGVIGVGLLVYAHR